MDSHLPFSGVGRVPGGDGTATPPPSEGVPILTAPVALQPFPHNRGMGLLHEAPPSVAASAWADTVKALHTARDQHDERAACYLEGVLITGRGWEAANRALTL